MPLMPDVGRLIFYDKNVDVPDGLKTKAAYDLALYGELGNPTRGVLTVIVINSFSFKNGVKADGSPLPWTAGEKATYMQGFRTAVTSVWNDRHRIRTSSDAPLMKDVGVLFYIWTKESMSVFDHSHWNLTVTKVDKFATSSVDGTGGSFATNGGANLDSGDLTGENKGGPVKQRGAVHEFGHMMGYRDEYTNKSGAAEDNPFWLGDRASIMNRGETVRDRHYVFLAEWLTQKFKPYAIAKNKRIDWSVNGNINIYNAGI